MYLVDKIDEFREEVQKRALEMKEELTTLIEILNKDVGVGELTADQKDALEYATHYGKEVLEGISRNDVAFAHTKIFAEKFNSLTK